MQPQQPQQTREQFIESLFALEKKDNYLSAKEAMPKLIKGIEKGCKEIGDTYGSAGGNAELEAPFQPFHETTNDGKRILDAIKLADPYEHIGLGILKEITSKIEKDSGNGRKTAVLLGAAILREGLKSKLKPMALKESLNDCLPAILASLAKQTRPITYSDIQKVASIAAENEELGKIFQEIYSQIGKDGMVEIDNSNLPTTYYDLVSGVRLRNCGFMYPYMARDEKGRSAIYNNPPVLICKEKLATPSQLDPILKSVFKSGKNELVIFCNEIDLSVSQYLAELSMGLRTASGQPFVFHTLVIKAPTLWKDWLFEDFAKITGAIIISPAEGTSLKGFSMSWLGTCDRITATKDESVITGIQDISDHIKALLEKNDNDSNLRASWLNTKTAILRLGANSDSELSHLKGKASDARNSSYLALQEGVVAGGGIALLNIAQELPNTPGGKILKKAFEAPFLQIVKNSEKECDIKLVGGNSGFDSRKGKIVDMHEEGIWDSSCVVKNAIITALSVASTILTTKPVILLKK
jgi:chaperonin GroEL